jgi:hypothetical protein
MNIGLVLVSAFFDRNSSHSCTAASTLMDFCEMGFPSSNALKSASKLTGVANSLCLRSGVESPPVLPLPELLPIKDGLGVRPVELGP